MKWSDLTYDDFYVPYDENQKAIRGFLLTTLGIDLEKLPNNFFEPYKYFDSKRSSKYECKRVFLSDIVGTSYYDYSCDGEIIFSYMKLKRADYYIKNGMVTRHKYHRMLKKPVQDNYVILSQNDDGSYFVDNSGNHRVVIYKILMLSEIANTYPWVYEESYDVEFKGFNDISKKYWVNAKINVSEAGS